ncbi:hypothetical protein HZU75_10865 [Chitinibacter fontanus]|uniref:Uncharacterized protein n=1 Tax=Chitinibacter fontanus TaxID=1737446 RepID=A0A7D5VA63_9NEIS|nr:hypothetical protein [Chitinibacter fontanus]QLI81991.1 hypothetical protein HZU75_10865 [Chitinibacter fontanus]
MSDDVATSSVSESHAASPVAAPSFLQRYRLHLIAVGAVVLIVIFFMAGVVLGMSKRNFEKKFYLEQIERLKTTLSASVEKQDELAKEIQELKIDLRAKKDHVTELEEKVADLERKTEKSEASPSNHAVPSQGHAEPTSTGDAGLDYVRLKAGDCVVDGGANTTANKWRECLQKSKK